jgi:Flp pilus assembly pilin Flp
MEGLMFRLFNKILRNEDGFTAIEYGLIVAMILVFGSQLVSQL